MQEHPASNLRETNMHNVTINEWKEWILDSAAMQIEVSAIVVAFVLYRPDMFREYSSDPRSIAFIEHIAATEDYGTFLRAYLGFAISKQSKYMH